MTKLSIDMLDVKQGDAYVIHLSNEIEDSAFTIVIDGGTKTNCEPLLEHVKNYHNGAIDLAICTHPDSDHINGLIELFGNYEIRKI